MTHDASHTLTCTAAVRLFLHVLHSYLRTLFAASVPMKYPQNHALGASIYTQRSQIYIGQVPGTVPNGYRDQSDLAMHGY